MDHDKDEDGGVEEEVVQYDTDALPEGEFDEGEEEQSGFSDSWPSFPERIEGFEIAKKCDPKVNEMDDRRIAIMMRARETIKNAPKPILEDVESQKNQIDKQLEVSDKRLNELLRFGEELVTNIRVANDRREYDRRMHEKEVREMLLEDLKAESDESQAKFDRIVARWSELESINEPMSLWDQIQEQKANIADIMKSKDEMIERCQAEIARLNQNFEIERVRQASDVACLVERVDNQIELLKDAYKNHINLLENTIEDERQLFAVSANEKWHQYFNAMNSDFERKSKVLKDRDDFYRQQTQRITEQQEELTKMTRIRLAKDCEALELELRKTRDAVLMNSEKLDYNYQVLQKRNEENIIVNNQQKRRVGKLHESLMEVRRRMRNMQSKSRQTVNKLSVDIRKLHALISEMEKKSHQMRLNNKQKFDRIWDMNYRELMNNINRIYKIDRLLHEQQLMMSWQRPEVDTTDINIEVKKNTEYSQSKTVQKIKDLEQLPPDVMRLFRNIFRKLTDRGGFLIEERLLKILEPYKERDKCLVRLDNIFLALRVHSLRDVAELTEVFEPYMYCPNCQTGLSEEVCTEVFLRDKNPIKKISGLAPTFDTDTTVGSVKSQDSLEGSEAAEGESDEGCPNHYLVMEPTLVLHAMTKYTTHRQVQLFNPYSNPTERNLNYISMEEKTIRKFWFNFRNCMPKEKVELWKKLEHGLNHYLEVLKMRQQYDNECVFLRKQNQEMRHLLQKFRC